MSVIKEVLGEIALKKIPARISAYQSLIDAAEPIFELDGKRIETACKEHAKNLMFYDVMLQECKSIEETIRYKIDELESTLYRNLNENSNRVLGTRDIQQYIKSDPQFVNAQEVLMEVIVVKRKLEAIVEALKSMGWSLNNITKLRIAQLEDAIL
jgi:chaperonin cofactor prefoldin